jgi:hypothetical protein
VPTFAFFIPSHQKGHCLRAEAGLSAQNWYHYTFSFRKMQQPEIDKPFFSSYYMILGSKVGRIASLLTKRSASTPFAPTSLLHYRILL